MIYIVIDIQHQICNIKSVLLRQDIFILIDLFKFYLTIFDDFTQHFLSNCYVIPTSKCDCDGWSCDSVVRTGTSCTGSVRTEYVLVLSVLPVPSVLLAYLSLIPPGISGSAITGYLSLISTSFNVALPRVIQHLIFTTLQFF